mmetsp:Transcript_32972/g.72316  ORF Transcript_32972/g.72316 Transcript_32972/m.72316 type:complete len:313 (+) Transcript_32972:394-1332(+)
MTANVKVLVASILLSFILLVVLKCTTGIGSILRNKVIASRQSLKPRQPRIAVQTIMIGSLIDDAITNHQSYCSKWGYDHILVTENSRPERKPTWEKLPSILRLFDEGYDYVMQIDYDAFFMNCSISLQPFVDQMEMEGSSWLFGGDQNIVINAGQMLFRNTDVGRHILQGTDGLWYPGFGRAGGLQDNLAFAAFLGGARRPNETEITSASQRCCDCRVTSSNEVKMSLMNRVRKGGPGYKCRLAIKGSRDALSLVDASLVKNISLVRQRDINSYDGRYRKGDFIFHCAGMQPKNACWSFFNHSSSACDGGAS